MLLHGPAAHEHGPVRATHAPVAPRGDWCVAQRAQLASKKLTTTQKLVRFVERKHECMRPFAKLQDTTRQLVPRSR